MSMTELERRCVDASSFTASDVSRFWANVDRHDSAECWPWTGKVGGRGYGRLYTALSTCTAPHRMSVAIHGTVIPPDKVVDHMCRNSLCVNPAHLRVVTQKTNSLENSSGLTAINAARTHCPSGHEYSGDNLIICRDGRRRCRTCTRAHLAKHRAIHPRPSIAKAKP